MADRYLSVLMTEWPLQNFFWTGQGHYCVLQEMGFHWQWTMWLWRHPDNDTHRQLLSIDQIWRRSTALTWSRWGCHRLADNIWLLAPIIIKLSDLERQDTRVKFSGGSPYNACPVRPRVTKFGSITHWWKGIFLGVSDAPTARGRSPSLPSFGIILYLCIHSLKQTYQIWHGNTYVEVACY